MDEPQTQNHNPKNNKNKKPKHKHPNPQSSNSPFKPSSEVKGLRFGGQLIVKSFPLRLATHPETLRLLSLTTTLHSTLSFLPTNFTILAHRAWHTLTLGLGTTNSKILIFVFESESMKTAVNRRWPAEIPLGEVNRTLIRGLVGCELARFKFRKGCLTFYVYAVRRGGNAGFECAGELRVVLECVVALKDFVDHTAMLALPKQRGIGFDSGGRI